MIIAAPVVQGRLVVLVSRIWCQTSFLDSVRGEFVPAPLGAAALSCFVIRTSQV